MKGEYHDNIFYWIISRLLYLLNFCICGSVFKRREIEMKYLLILFILLIPQTISTGCHHAFESLDDQLRFDSIRMYHGECAVATDFSHAIRTNGERIRLK